MSHVAFTPKEGVEITGGSCAGVNGETINFGDLLADTEHGNVEGVIVTDDPAAIDALDALPDFKRTEVPEGYGPPEPPEPPTTIDVSEDGLNRLTRPRIIEAARELNERLNLDLTIEERPTRAEMATELRAQLVEAQVLNEDGTSNSDEVTA